MEPLLNELQNSFTNLSQRRGGDYQATDILPGEQYAILKLESMDRNRDRSRGVEQVRMGVNARSFKFILSLTLGVDCTGLDEQAALIKADTEGAKAMLDLEHQVAEIKTQVSTAYGLVEDLELELPVDMGPSQTLRDPGTWVVNVTASVSLTFWVHRDINGLHTYPLGVS